MVLMLIAIVTSTAFLQEVKGSLSLDNSNEEKTASETLHSGLLYPGVINLQMEL